jgi:protein-tyrosine phosphatase
VPSGRRVLVLCTGNYYRSRFAELVFNHLSAARGLDARADSAGLARDCHHLNPGPLSPYAVARLRARGLPVPAAPRGPRDATAEDFVACDVVVALQESEHRAMVEDRFEAHAGRVRYWSIADVDQRAPDDALAEIERLVVELLDELAA